MPVPAEVDWGDYRADLDQTYAHKLFAGHTTQEMLPHCPRNVIERTVELRWMPEVPFRCYVFGFRDFVIAGEFEQPSAPDAASCFLMPVVEKLEEQPSHILPIMPELLRAVRRIATNQESFEASKRIHGSFQEILGRIEAPCETRGQP